MPFCLFSCSGCKKTRRICYRPYLLLPDTALPTQQFFSPTTPLPLIRSVATHRSQGLAPEKTAQACLLHRKEKTESFSSNLYSLGHKNTSSSQNVFLGQEAEIQTIVYDQVSVGTCSSCTSWCTCAPVVTRTGASAHQPDSCLPSHSHVPGILPLQVSFL